MHKACFEAAAEIERLTRENAKLVAANPFDRTDAIDSALRREIERLRAALVEYGRHAHRCPESEDTAGNMCDCGFSEALRDAGEK